LLLVAHAPGVPRRHSWRRLSDRFISATILETSRSHANLFSILISIPILRAPPFVVLLKLRV
jgi:hypothetical protein